MKKAHLMSDFIKKISPRLGLEPTKMRQDLRKSVSILLEREENVLSFGCYFSRRNYGTVSYPFSCNSKTLLLLCKRGRGAREKYYRRLFQADTNKGLSEGLIIWGLSSSYAW